MNEGQVTLFIARLRKMREKQKELVDSETRANFSNVKTYSVLDLEKEDLAMLASIIMIADNMLMGVDDENAV